MKVFQKLGRMPIALTLPALTILLVVFGIPIVLLFLISLNAPAFSIVNYQSFFDQRANVKVLFQTIEISFVVTAACLIIGYPTAYLIVAAPKRLRIVLTVLVIIPYLTSALARTYAWIVILSDRGLINDLLRDLGLIARPLPLLYNRTSVYIGMVHIMLPVMMLPLVTVMMGIDKSLTAAARSMGARPLTAFWRVFFPLSLPGVRSGSLLVFVICLGFYITPAALGGLSDAMLSTFIASENSAFDLARTATSAFVLLALALLVVSVLGLDLSGTQAQAPQRTRKAGRSKLFSFRALREYLSEFVTPHRAKRWTSQLYKAGGDSIKSKISRLVFVSLVMTYLLFPSVLVVIMSFSAGTSLEFPPSGLSVQWYRSFFGDSSWYGAALISFQIAVAVAILSTTVGTLAAFGLNRAVPKARRFVTMLILAPITLPVVVVGIAAFLGLAKLGLIDSMAGVILAHSVGAIGFVVVIVSGTLANFDHRLVQAAHSMRAGPLQTFLRVTLPLIRPGVIGGGIFAFLHSFDEIVITSFVSGFSIRTLPLKLWENIRQEIDPTIAAVASLLMLLPVLWLVVLYVAWWRSKPRVLHAPAGEPATAA
ncbi:putative spermidine/putrescine transport system permease protein [Bradyrhizobium sp. RT9b]|uniref:ABC transporter permease subunit n=1 Tax=Bradyrhizobium sp. RT9b TaxID=3156385 RepID=UPI003393A2A6